MCDTYTLLADKPVFKKAVVQLDIIIYIALSTFFCTDSLEHWITIFNNNPVQHFYHHDKPTISPTPVSIQYSN